jgi:hypothetical protein
MCHANASWAHTCSSPELVAKLGHDYTVYAFDYSEYETPLVGQGMLSWILASASTTPNAPAEQSQTMVTGRVCKNILGLFSNGIKETLEVKLKLVPVPTCMQSEYVENMERYHNLSKLVPEGPPDYNAWAQFLEANPAIRQLAQPVPLNPAMSIEPSHMGGLDTMHQMLARQSPAENVARFDSFQDNMSFNTHDTRASSPAMSTASFFQYPFHQDPRPDSRGSFHSESASFSHYYSPADTTQDFQQYQQDQQDQQEQEEEGPPKKRARVTQAKRPRKTVLGPKTDSLRVTASTAASVRLHKPAAGHAGAAVSIEQVPRAPTPRPGNVAMPVARGPLRPPAPSLLRNSSVEGSRPYVSPYEPSLHSDAAQDSADDGGGSPGDTPLNMPSSPPVMRTASSSPDLPSLPLLNDSGFVSDIAQSREDEDTLTGNKTWAESDLPGNNEETQGTTTEDPIHARPQSAQPVLKPMQNAGPTAVQLSNPALEALLRPLRTEAEVLQSTAEKVTPVETRRHSHSTQEPRPINALAPTDSTPFNDPTVDTQLPDNVSANAGSPDAILDPANTENAPVKTSGAPNDSAALAKKPRPAKPRGLERSQTWAGEILSDNAAPADGKQPRSGSGARRKYRIRNQLEEALGSGKMPQYCNHCGQIDTPAWRRAFTRIEYGSHDGIKLSSKGTAICALEPMLPEEGGDGTPRYRVFKLNVTDDEYTHKIYDMLVLCNPCGLYLGKNNAMRPQEMWLKAQAQAAALAQNGGVPKRKRPRKKAKGENDSMMSDAIVPDSDCVQPDGQDTAKGPSASDGTADSGLTSANTQPLQEKPYHGPKPTEHAQLDRGTAQEALFRALQSSPAGLRGTKASPIEVGEDLTPKPTRRILFPSPRRSGEKKSLGEIRSVPSMDKPDSISKASKGTTPAPGLQLEEVDKENCPPVGEEDGLSHLFEGFGSTRTTPTKSRTMEDLLKTPTPASRRRVPLTPKRGGDVLGLTTPSRVNKTPRTAKRAATAEPETPFTRQLNALLSDVMASSPSQAIDFSAFPTFNTPGRAMDTNGHFGDFLSNDYLSSDLPIPSSPNGGINFGIFEDNTHTVGLWSGASIFETTGTNTGDHHGAEHSGMSMDFNALLEGMVGDANHGDDAHAQTVSKAVTATTTEEGTSEQRGGTPRASLCSGATVAEKPSNSSDPPPQNKETAAPVLESIEGQPPKPNEAEKAADTPLTVRSSKEKSKSPFTPPKHHTPAPASSPEASVKVELVRYEDSP